METTIIPQTTTTVQSSILDKCELATAGLNKNYTSLSLFLSTMLSQSQAVLRPNGPEKCFCLKFSQPPATL